MNDPVEDIATGAVDPNANASAQATAAAATAAVAAVAPTPAAATSTAPDVKKMVADAVAPLREQVELTALAKKFSLNDEQAALVRKYQQEGNLTEDRAYVLARYENQDKFASRGYDQTKHRMLPPTGTSPQRTAPTVKSYAEKIAEAKDNAERENIARTEFRSRVTAQMANHYRMSIPQ